MLMVLFDLKARLENVWRTIPFLDHSKYIEHIDDFGYPLVQETELVVPEGAGLRYFCGGTGNSCAEYQRKETLYLAKESR